MALTLLSQGFGAGPDERRGGDVPVFEGCQYVELQR